MIELAFQPPFEPWSLNMERTKHWSWRARRARDWRLCAMSAARNAGVGPQPPSVIEVELPFTRNGRRDPSNYLPAVKAAVDGLVDAGLWPDDTPDYVSVAEPSLVVGSLVIVRIRPR